MERKIIFLAENSLQKIRNYILDGIAIVIFFYASLNFFKNPIVISTILLFIVLSFLTSGYNRIKVYSDGIEFEFKHIIGFLSKKTFYSINEVQSINADLQLSKKGFIVSEILTTYLPGNSIWNIIDIRLRNGAIKKIGTKIYKDDLVKAFTLFKKVSKNTIEINGI